jgi:hypothetical protein
VRVLGTATWSGRVVFERFIEPLRFRRLSSFSAISSFGYSWSGGESNLTDDFEERKKSGSVARHQVQLVDEVVAVSGRQQRQLAHVLREAEVSELLRVLLQLEGLQELEDGLLLHPEGLGRRPRVLERVVARRAEGALPAVAGRTLELLKVGARLPSLDLRVGRLYLLGEAGDHRLVLRQRLQRVRTLLSAELGSLTAGAWACRG